ncbi:MAG: aminotransferase class III-fold pyridoxal phosphate-dependent enzyme, partial [Chitinophagaceae bacterium]
ACAAALAVLEVMEEEQLMSNATRIGEYLMDALKQLPNIMEVRGRGLMIGIQLPEAFSHVKKDLLLKHHIFTGEAKPNVIRLLPALNIGITEADIFLEATKKELQA